MGKKVQGVKKKKKVMMDDPTFRFQLQMQFIIEEIIAVNNNCFYQCMALARWGDRRLFRQVQNDLHNYVVHHRGEFEEHYEHRPASFDREIQDLRRIGPMCPNFAPLAAALNYQFNVVIVNPSVPEPFWTISPANEMFEQIVYVSFHNRNHYNVLYPRDPVACRLRVSESVQQQQLELENRRRRLAIAAALAAPINNHLPQINNQNGAVNGEDESTAEEQTNLEPKKSSRYNLRPRNDQSKINVADVFNAEDPGDKVSDDATNNPDRKKKSKKRKGSQEDAPVGTGDVASTLKQSGKVSSSKRRRKNATRGSSAPREEHQNDDVPNQAGEGGAKRIPKKKSVREAYKKRNRYRCKYQGCDKSYADQRGLYHHVKATHKAVEQQCRLCNKRLPSIMALRGHMVNVHKGRRFECGHCGQKFKRKITRDQHVLNIHDTGAFKCPRPDCNEVFKSALYLQVHIARVHASGKLPCPHEDCSAVFKNNNLLQFHITHFHGGPKFKCEFCWETFKWSCHLTRHVRTVHSIERPYECDVSEDCNYTCKTFAYLQIHIKFVHVKERPHVCQLCDVAYILKRDLARHMLVVHDQFVVMGTKKPYFQCKLCKPPKQLCNSASWAFHRMVHHPDFLKDGGDANNLDNLWTTPQNKVFIDGDNDKDLAFLLANSKGRCDTCEIRFFSDDDDKAQINHYRNYHELLSVKEVDFTNLRLACRRAEDEQGRRDAFIQIYQLSLQVFPGVDARRKVYDILLIPASVQEEDLVKYVNTDGSVFYINTGGMGLGIISKNRFVSLHHTTGKPNPVCTNSFMAVVTEAQTEYKAYLINEKFVDATGQSLSRRQLQKKMEATDIFTLFVFAHFYNREDVFFQRLEIGEMKKFAVQEIATIIQEVKDCKGVLWNLTRFKISMAKAIKISTTGVDDTTFSECTHCTDSPLLVSKNLAGRHAIKCHRQPAQNSTEQLFAMPSSLIPVDVHQALHIFPENELFSVYVAVGSDVEISSIAQAHAIITEGYIGQATGFEVAAYHFNINVPFSGLKKLAAKYRHVYIIRRWEFDDEHQMHRAENALIEIGKLYEWASDSQPRLTLVNKYLHCYNVAHLFSIEEWNIIASTVANDKEKKFQMELPRFIEGGKLFEDVVEITHLIPSTERSHDSSSNESEEDSPATDDEEEDGDELY